MREWVIKSYSGYKGLVLQDCEMEEAGPGEVRLRIEAFALNWGDADLMLDNYSFSFPKFPARIGMEACGIIDQIGEGVTGLKVGERYCTLPYFYFNRGASAESILIEPRYLVKAPEGLSAVEASSIWMMYMTAYFPMVELSEAGPGRNILIPAGTGTAGTAALKIGSMLGANMMATTRYAYNIDYLKSCGANHVFVDDGTQDLAEFIMDHTDGKGIDAAFDPIGAGMINRYSKALAKDAKIIIYGWLDAQAPSVPMLDMIVQNASFHPYSLFNYVGDPERCERGKAFVQKHIASGALKPIIDKTYPMEGYIDAWDYMKNQRKSHGKVVISVTS